MDLHSPLNENEVEVLCENSESMLFQNSEK